MTPSVAGIVMHTHASLFLFPLLSCKHFCIWLKVRRTLANEQISPEFPLMKTFRLGPNVLRVCRRYVCAGGTCLRSTIQFAAVMKATYLFFNFLNSWNIRLLYLDRPGFVCSQTRDMLNMMTVL